MAPIELLLTVTIQFWAIVFISLLCELGKMVTNEFELFSGELNQCNWYAFPIAMQRMLLIVVVNSEQPAKLRGFGNVECTRETFKRVIGNADSFLKSVSFFYSFLIFLSDDRRSMQASRTS